MRLYGAYFQNAYKLPTDSSVNNSRRRIAAHPVEQQLEEAVGKLVGVTPRPEPRVRPVRGREEEERRGSDVEVRAQLALLDPLAEERADPFLVASSLAEEL